MGWCEAMGVDWAWLNQLQYYNIFSINFEVTIIFVSHTDFSCPMKQAMLIAMLNFHDDLLFGK